MAGLLEHTSRDKGEAVAVNEFPVVSHFPGPKAQIMK